METLEIIDALYTAACEDLNLKQELLNTEKEAVPLKAFCDVARKHGFMLYEMDVITAGEEAHAAMKRSTNGGGENSPMLDNQDDYYSMLIGSLKQ
ncbi:MAG: hypothetical protein Q4B67_03150 [Eubacteriales bacterium]|nr:hypothetical protein [Eubacteriales bacterium]